jgi:hypothetical protein
VRNVPIAPLCVSTVATGPLPLLLLLLGPPPPAGALEELLPLLPPDELAQAAANVAVSASVPARRPAANHVARLTELTTDHLPYESACRSRSSIGTASIVHT